MEAVVRITETGDIETVVEGCQDSSCSAFADLIAGLLDVEIAERSEEKELQVVVIGHNQNQQKVGTR